MNKLHEDLNELVGFCGAVERLWQDVKETEKALDKKKDALKRALAKRA